jgi:hypothetical protein
MELKWNSILLFCLLAASNVLMAGQGIWRYTEDINYHSRDTSINIEEFIQQADSLWRKYRTIGHDEVNVFYANDILINIEYDSIGRGKYLNEFYEDTVAHSLHFFTADSSYSYTQYNPDNASDLYMEQWLPNDSTMEYWYYNTEGVLIKLLKVTTLKTKKIKRETTYLNFKGTTIESYFDLRNSVWVLEKEVTIVEP